MPPTKQIVGLDLHPFHDPGSRKVEEKAGLETMYVGTYHRSMFTVLSNSKEDAIGHAHQMTRIVVLLTNIQCCLAPAEY